MAWCARRPAAHARARVAARRVLHRPVHRVHVLPRRARAAEAGAGYLTRFYLMVSLGGAIGAALVGIVAPLVLPAHFELGLGLIAAACLLTWQVRRNAIVFGAARAGVRHRDDRLRDLERASTSTSRRSSRRAISTACCACRRPASTRSASIGRWSTARSCTACSTSHRSSIDRRRAITPTTSGIGRLLETLHPRKDPLRVGVIGLGTGTLASYGTPGDLYRFYDINPAVIAHRPARTSPICGQSEATHRDAARRRAPDARARAAADLDVLAIDAFSSDAIPVHLITSEALAFYAKHMKPTASSRST